MNLRIPSDNNRTGEYNFSPEATADFRAAQEVAALDLATFLLGDVTSFARYVNNPQLVVPGRAPKTLVLLRPRYVASIPEIDT